MTIGTEGPDNLSNNPAVNQETVDALGGDDVITIVRPSNALNPTAAVDVQVNGAAGSDTLIVNESNARIQGLFGSGYDGGIIVRLGLGTSYGISWTSIERFELTAALLGGNSFQGGAVYSTGDSIDILRFGSADSTSAGGSTINTNGGNDEVYISGRAMAEGSNLTINLGTGDDVADYRSIERGAGTYLTANGGDGNDRLTGSVFRDQLRGDAGNDNFSLWVKIHPLGGELPTGGDDIAEGGSGNDNFFFGSTLTAGDTVNGGDGVDTLVVQGDYAGGLFVPASVTGIEGISILAGSNANFGETGANSYHYSIITHDANFAAGVRAKINGAALLPTENFTFDGSAETDGGFVVYGSRGIDTLTGGLGTDIFFYAEGRFVPGDTVNGGPGGYDGIFFRGNYTIDFNAPGYHGLLTSIENMTLSSASDERYARGGGTEFDYDIKLADVHLAAGVTLTVSGALLMANETMALDGSLETDGILNIFGGAAADTLKGGGQDDLIHGNLGADLIWGGGGADLFRYQSTAESSSNALDQILDFTPGSDQIDLSRIDANNLVGGDQAFTWIGSNAFSGTAGELRVENLNNMGWFVMGDTDGDGSEDLLIQLIVPPASQIGAGDFIL